MCCISSIFTLENKTMHILSFSTLYVLSIFLSQKDSWQRRVIAAMEYQLSVLVNKCLQTITLHIFVSKRQLVDEGHSSHGILVECVDQQMPMFESQTMQIHSFSYNTLHISVSKRQLVEEGHSSHGILVESVDQQMRCISLPPRHQRHSRHKALQAKCTSSQ